MCGVAFSLSCRKVGHTEGINTTGRSRWSLYIDSYFLHLPLMVRLVLMCCYMSVIPRNGLLSYGLRIGEGTDGAGRGEARRSGLGFLRT